MSPYGDENELRYKSPYGGEKGLRYDPLWW